VALFGEHTAVARGAGVGPTTPAAGAATAASLPVVAGEVGVASPLSGSVIEMRALARQTVARGDVLAVITAMKMETEIHAPCSGVVVRVANLAAGHVVAEGQIVVTIAASADASAPRGDTTWASVLYEVRTLRRLADVRLRDDSMERGVVRQRERGKLNCRQRIALLLDEGSFREVGSVTGFSSYDENGRIEAFTPSNHVGGWGRIDGRTAIVCADGFTSRGGHADGAIGAKSLYLDRLSMELRVPSASARRFIGLRQRRRDGSPTEKRRGVECAREFRRDGLRRHEGSAGRMAHPLL
jgi:biotin carboxyl carrier protein